MILIAIRSTLVMLVLVSGIYPLIVWGIGQVAFRHAANGSLITRDGKVVGSSLIGQSFTGQRYFHPRPGSYDGVASGGSNLGPTSRKLRDRIAADVRNRTNMPADAVTTSASGLDPHISPENARQQAARVAKARGLTIAEVEKMIAARTEGRFLGVFGEPRVNVFLLNLDLDDMMRGHAPPSRT